MRRVLFLAVALAMSPAQAAKPDEVRVVNPDASPVPVKVVAFPPAPQRVLQVDPANGRFQLTMSVDLFPGVSGSNQGTNLVPEGKVMVIEHLSVYGYVPGGEKMVFDVTTTCGGHAQRHWLVSADEGDGFPEVLFNGTPVEVEVFRTSESLRLYGDPSSDFFFAASRNSIVGQGHATITVSGYFTDVVP